MSPSNRVSRREDKALESARVRHVEISSSGHWMSTVDAREEELGYPPEVFLKIWAWDTTSSRWKLHSRIDQPHGSKYLTKLQFSPQHPSLQAYLSSCGDDGCVKIWRLAQRAEEDLWLPQATLSFSSGAVKDLSWSPDGTLFAVTLADRVMLYDTSFTPIDTLSTFEHRSNISAHFVGNRYLVVVGERSLTPWDLITRSVLWTHVTKGGVDFTVVHQHQTSFAVFLKPRAEDGVHETDVYCFSITSSRPRRALVLPFALRNVAAAGPRSKAFNLIGLTRDSQMVSIDHESSAAPAVKSLLLTFQTGKPTLFHDMFGRALSEPVEPISKVPSLGEPESLVGEVFRHPSHLLPPISSLFDPLVSSFLVPVSQHNDEEHVVSDDEDSDDDAMEDIVVTSLATQPVSSLVNEASIRQLTDFFRNACHTQPSATLANGKTKKARVNGVAKPLKAV